MTVTLVADSHASTSSQPQPQTQSIPPFDPSTLESVNHQLATSTPRQILEWAVTNLPNLYQTTAFGLTGLAATDMLHKIARKQGKKSSNVPLIFVDTLYHFKETLDLAERVRNKYNVRLEVYRPPGVQTTQEFEDKYGKQLWITDEDTYDYLVKVEPARRAYSELNVQAVITGRRQSQGADRAHLQPIEVDSTGLVKVNPLCRWTFDEVKDYVEMAGVPTNPLLEEGYKSIGDWHSTKVPLEGENEREGRWAGNKEKTECGLHKDYFQMKRAFEKKRREEERAELDKARGEDEVGSSSVQLGLLAL
ncbi:putative Phosphoadenylyl-sulfate reductase thioredoxin [Meredithblackwellia eburnea MCA 4105]